ncbi:hypothetical protein [Streptomyces sp. ISL-11]|nr:hypothetical protein [Streptomyces sp. ISL-11]MBT2385670.1 hypothetical protein [Streptomyces sp. ISL-11]
MSTSSPISLTAALCRLRVEPGVDHRFQLVDRAARSGSRSTATTMPHY